MQKKHLAHKANLIRTIIIVIISITISNSNNPCMPLWCLGIRGFSEKDVFVYAKVLSLLPLPHFLSLYPLENT